MQEIEKSTYWSKLESTKALGSVLEQIILIMKDCPQFTLDIAKIEKVSTDLKSPLSLYSKALFNEGVKGIESTSYMEHAIASYKNNLYFEFGSLLGYTMYALTGGKNLIKPANETIVEYVFKE